MGTGVAFPNLDIMASFRTPALRHVVSGAAPYLRATQRRWAQVHDVRFLATQQSDRIIEKYKEKLAKKAQEEGLRDISELKEVYKDKILCPLRKQQPHNLHHFPQLLHLRKYQPNRYRPLHPASKPSLRISTSRRLVPFPRKSSRRYGVYGTSTIPSRYAQSFLSKFIKPWKQRRRNIHISSYPSPKRGKVPKSTSSSGRSLPRTLLQYFSRIWRNT